MICTVIKGGSITGKKTMNRINFAGAVFILRLFSQKAILTGNHGNSGCGHCPIILHQWNAICQSA